MEELAPIAQSESFTTVPSNSQDAVFAARGVAHDPVREQKTVALANQYLAKQIDRELLVEGLFQLYSPVLFDYAQKLLDKRCYFLDAQTLAHFCLVEAGAVIFKWDRKQSFLLWLGWEMEEVLEEVDKGRGLEWDKLQAVFNPEVDLDIETRRMARAVNALPFEPRRLIYRTLLNGWTVAQAAKESALTELKAQAILDRSLEDCEEQVRAWSWFDTKEWKALQEAHRKATKLQNEEIARSSAQKPLKTVTLKPQAKPRKSQRKKSPQSRSKRSAHAR